MLQPRAWWLISVCALGLIGMTSMVYAQRTYSKQPQQYPSEIRPTEIRASQGRAVQQVSLSVKDSTLSYVLHALARQANLSLLYNKELPALSQRITVQIVKSEVMDAFAGILKGTGLIAIKTSDGETVSIREASKNNGARSVEHGQVTGHIVDSMTGEGVSGVTVRIQGTSLSVVTDLQGNFVIKDIPAGEHVILCKIIGYVSAARTIYVMENRTTKVRIALKAAANILSGIVTTATGTQRRVEVANDIVRIDADKIMERAAVKNLTDLIEAARVPGVFVSRGSGDPGAPSRIRIRGLRSMTQSNDPVVVVDGNWIDATVGTPSGINDIDPSSIETVEIVRGPSATTLYGPDAANGVIVITTKKGHAGSTRWRVSYSRDWGQTYGTMPLAYNGSGTDITRGGARFYCPIKSVIAGKCIQDSVVIYNPNDPLLAQEGTGATNRYVAGVEGGTTTVMYSISGSVTNTLGVRQIAPIDRIRYRILNIPISKKFERPTSQEVKSVTTALTMIPTSNITLGLTVTGSQSDLPTNTMNAKYAGLASGLDQMYSLDTVELWGIWASGQSTAISLEESSPQRTNVSLGGTIDWRPQGGWLIKANAGVNRTLNEGRGFTRLVVCDGVICHDTTGSGDASFNRSLNAAGRFTITKKINLGVFSKILDLQPSLGGDYRRTSQARLGASVQDIPIGVGSLLSADKQSLSQYVNTSAVAGWYATVRVGILQRLYFDLGTRRDVGSARKSLVNGTHYPKLGGSYLISDEPFWPSQSLVKTFRVRAAVGYSSIQPDLADIRGSYGSRLVFQNGSYQRSLSLNGVGNTALLPERVMELELGFDADLFEDRVSIIATYAQSYNYNAMVWRTLPPSAGANTSAVRRKENVGQVRNRNVEVSSQFRLLDTKLTRLEFTHTLTLRENVVTKLGNKIIPYSNTTVGRIQEGYPIAGVWVQRMLGYRDNNSDGLLAPDEITLSDSLAYAGWSQPRYEAGYGITVTLLGRLSNDARFSQRSRYVVRYGQDNRYGLEDATASLDAQAYALASNINQRRSISDLRWNSASVVYHLPQHALSALRLRTLSVGLKATNLKIWTNYGGRDPGVNNDILNSELITNSNITTPQPRQFTLDFNLGL